MSIFCPECGKDDMIQKVSAIYSSGITSGSYSGPTSGVSVPIGSGKPSVIGGYTTLKGTSQTEISRKLAPPKHPTRPTNGCLILSIIGLWMVAGMFGMSIGKNSSVAPYFAIVVIFCIIGALIAYNNSEQKKRRPEIEAAEKKWQIAMSKWNELYYCARNDCVFTAEGELASADRVADILYR